MKAMKEGVDQAIAQKRAEKESYMKNFLGSLKHKPKKADLIAHQNAEVSALASSVDATAQAKDGQGKILSPLRYNVDAA